MFESRARPSDTSSASQNNQQGVSDFGADDLDVLKFDLFTIQRQLTDSIFKVNNMLLRIGALPENSSSPTDIQTIEDIRRWNKTHTQPFRRHFDSVDSLQYSSVDRHPLLQGVNPEKIIKASRISLGVFGIDIYVTVCWKTHGYAQAIWRHVSEMISRY